MARHFEAFSSCLISLFSIRGWFEEFLLLVDMKTREREGRLVQVWWSPAAHRAAQLVGGKENIGQAGESRRGLLQRQKKLSIYIFCLFKFSFSSAKPPSVIPGLCFPFCHFSIILSISVGLLSLGCFLFSCFPIFHYLPFFLLKCFYNRVRRMWKLVTIWHTNCSVTTAALWFHL